MGSANVDFLQTLNEIRTAIWQIPDNILARAPWHSFGDARSVALLCSSVAFFDLRSFSEVGSEGLAKASHRLVVSLSPIQLRSGRP